jgi:hypothetical protein
VAPSDAPQLGRCRVNGRGRVLQVEVRASGAASSRLAGINIKAARLYGRI